MVSFEDFKKMDLRVAKIIEVQNHPDADRLYVLRIDVGDEVKQIVAGIREHYSIRDLVGKKIVVVNNLESTVIRGEESHGMLLAANSENIPIILVPERDVPEGTQIR
jgi:methionyl-tRNA synthetase